MRVLSLFMLMAIAFSVSAKHPTSVERSQFHTYKLFGSNLQIDVPVNMKKEREYYHYWDKCPEGGYTVAFEGACNDKRGVSVQLSVHNIPEAPEQMHNWYDPREQCLEKSRILEDTSYYLGNKLYKVFATLAAQYPGSKRSGAHNNNYQLSYYIMADDRVLEFQYFCWDKDGHNLDYWKEMGHHMASTIYWQSNGWLTAKK